MGWWISHILMFVEIFNECKISYEIENNICAIKIIVATNLIQLLPFQQSVFWVHNFCWGAGFVGKRPITDFKQQSIHQGPSKVGGCGDGNSFFKCRILRFTCFPIFSVFWNGTSYVQVWKSFNWLAKPCSVAGVCKPSTWVRCTHYRSAWSWSLTPK